MIHVLAQGLGSWTKLDLNAGPPLGCLCDLGQVTSLSSGSSSANYRSSDPHWVFVRILTKHKVSMAPGPRQVYREGVQGRRTAVALRTTGAKCC